MYEAHHLNSFIFTSLRHIIIKKSSDNEFMPEENENEPRSIDRYHITMKDTTVTYIFVVGKGSKNYDTITGTLQGSQ